MRKFRVIALSLSGKGRGKIYSSGDVVTQENLNAPVDKLVEGGFLKELDEEIKSAPEEVVDFEAEESLINLRVDESPEVEETAPQPEESTEATEEIDDETDSEEGNDLLNELKKEEVGTAPESDEHVVKTPSLEEVNYKFLIKELETLGVHHTKNISKKEAYELWVEAKKLV